MISAGRGGRIINLLSTDAFRPTETLSAYGAAKLGCGRQPRPWRQNSRSTGSLVNALTPGSIITAERLAMLQAGTLAEFSVLRA
jgi:NAD(P)-dependent dehydrogenase (short-subunit alcohol dehydrogenase family)